MTLPENARLRDVKLELAAADGFQGVDGAEHLFGPAIIRGKKIGDLDVTLHDSGIRQRDKMMLSVLPSARESLASIHAIALEVDALESKQDGSALHAEEVTKQMLKLDAIELSGIDDGARDIVRARRKQVLARLEQLSSSGGTHAS